MQSINKQVASNCVLTDLFIGQDADVVYDVGEGGLLNLNALAIGNQVNFKVRLLGSKAQVNVKCVYLSSANNDNVINFNIEHETGQTCSAQVVKGIAAQTGKTDFYGRIRIYKDSQQCEGSQIHHGLLLSDQAHIKATPELEIYADDVKCSHGSSVGNLDQNALFYLLSRGIDEKTARQLLIKAFLLSDMPVKFEQKITEWTEKYE